ncbi:UDP-N-acetylmuramoyl-L-alanyl-D-glutamate--LD-lysine ligase [Oxobacter pfennigii]|uniref:UDP-N-acetylmuramoyl-L-alanyl-D-glutamate--2,6-diaminopimelate ligase n=1 Tax=Oxobacter pfennigii TaxID=36849 RepID=A0A0P8W8J1_9CLOT|nr:UDP-N-acetylmuramoyl-L-alanyl-D-glutamate--2,6-diaminopimelate ligase [Oxobacter pfennigii]KPU44041.1 UDP-N-acetylmuramoyl-L-alanyl-D-glutamate--LD-lysine ligase [Oxobacter pfennigii]
MKLKDIMMNINHTILKGTSDKEIEGIAYDSRAVKEGYLFVCIKGFKADGHDFINDAVKKGAKAIILEKEGHLPDGVTAIKVGDSRMALALASAAFFEHPSKNVKLIGVTGTNGKTTTTYLIKSILDRCGYNVSILGTISNIIGNKAIDASRTTPESYDLQVLFSEMRQLKTHYCIMEVSSHSLELKRVAGLSFNSGIFTNLTRDHLDFHETFENYFNAKLKLFKSSKTAIINIDDEYGRKMKDNIEIPVITYAEKERADVWATDVEITANFSKFILNYKEEKKEIMLPMPGRFNVYNALAAAASCISEGISLEDIKKGLEEIKGVPGRSEVIDSGRGFTVIIDYAHTPDGLENILNTVREYVQGRVITIFGCGGDRDKTKRTIMGEVAAKLSEIAIVTSDNPRSEDPEAIIKDILPGVIKINKEYFVIPDRKEAIKRAINLGKEGDVIVVAGKGHETYQVLKDKTIDFDEKQIINEILNQM